MFRLQKDIDKRKPLGLKFLAKPVISRHDEIFCVSQKAGFYSGKSNPFQTSSE